MPRPKRNRNSTELDAEIARVQQEAGAQLQRLQEERRSAQHREDCRRGEVLRAYLDGPCGAEIRRVLDPIVAAKDRSLFDLPPSARQASASPSRRANGLVAAAPAPP